MGCLVNYFVSSLVLILTITGKQCLASTNTKYQRPFSKWRVAIVNQLSSNQNLFVHCKSKDNDLGDHYVPVEQNFQWEFRENAFSTTLFWCTLKTPTNLHASFEVFWREQHDWLSYRCNYTACIWVARDNGIYLHNTPEGSLELIHNWEG